MKRFRKTIRKPETLGRRRSGPNLSFDITLDFHGYTTEEALCDLEEELFVNQDCAFLIIHGKGDGILRTSIRAFLASTDLVRSFEPGEIANIPGGSGVTIART